MKKFLSLLLALVMCMSLVACGGGSSSSEPSAKTKPKLDVEQEIVNICCDYENRDSLRGFEMGTVSKTSTEDGLKVKAKGSYLFIDEYGEIDGTMLFDIEFTATWDGSSSYYDIDVDKRNIRRKG